MSERVLVTGNTVVEALLYLDSLDRPFDDPRLARIDASHRKIVLVTMHRRESWGEPMRRVLGAVRTLIETHHDIPVVLPTHPNQAVRNDVTEMLGQQDRVLVCEALSYVSLARLLAKADLILSDRAGSRKGPPPSVFR